MQNETDTAPAAPQSTVIESSYRTDCVKRAESHNNETVCYT